MHWSPGRKFSKMPFNSVTIQILSVENFKNLAEATNLKLIVLPASQTKEHHQNQMIWIRRNLIGRQMDRSAIQSSYGSLHFAKVTTG